MAISYAQGEVAGVDTLVDGDHCKALILDGANLQPGRMVNQRFGADGTVYTQVLDTDTHGKRFGVRFPFLPVDKFNDMITAINSALEADQAFNVSLTDDFQSVDTDCTIDGQNWLQYPDQRTTEDYVADVVMRFITV